MNDSATSFYSSEDLFNQLISRVKAQPSDSDAWQQLANIYALRGQVEKAKLCRERADKLLSNSVAMLSSSAESPSSLSHSALLQEQTLLLREILQELKQLNAELKIRQGDVHLPLSENDLSPREESENQPDEAQVEVTTPGSLVTDWLTTKNITVKNQHQQDENDKTLNQLSNYLGERYDSLNKLYKVIKKNLSTGNAFIHRLSDQEEIANATQFCTMLNRYAFLTTYTYQKPTKTIHASTPRFGTAINFFTGEWFERYIFTQIVAYLTKHQLSFSYLLNPQITLPNGDDFELDILLLINNNPYWFECKTGSYSNYILKYSEFRQTLGIPPQQAVLTLLDINEETASSLTALYHITVVNQKTFLNPLLRAISDSETEGDLPTPLPS